LGQAFGVTNDGLLKRFVINSLTKARKGFIVMIATRQKKSLQGRQQKNNPKLVSGRNLTPG
jgi:hypothetical protein